MRKTKVKLLRNFIAEAKSQLSMRKLKHWYNRLNRQERAKVN
jgi:hypothetical protein